MPAPPSRTRTRSRAATVHVAGLLVACVGFLVLLAAGAPEFRPFPPGVVLLLAVAAAVLRWPQHRWPPLVGALSCVAILVGAFVFTDGTLARLAMSADMTSAEVVLHLGTLVQIGGVALAAASGAVAVLRPRSATR